VGTARRTGPVLLPSPSTAAQTAASLEQTCHAPYPCHYARASHGRRSDAGLCPVQRPVQSPSAEPAATGFHHQSERNPSRASPSAGPTGPGASASDLSANGAGPAVASYVAPDRQLEAQPWRRFELFNLAVSGRPQPMDRRGSEVPIGVVSQW
jgi:hypothetical protein